MELALHRKDQAMTGAMTAGIAFISAAIPTATNYILSRRREKEKDAQESNYAEWKRKFDFINITAERLSTVETRLDHAMSQIEELRTEKLELVAQAALLKHEIADLKLQIAAYQQNEIAFRVQITDLQVREATKAGELRAAEQRLAAIRSAHTSGTLTDHTLYQATKE